MKFIYTLFFVLFSLNANSGLFIKKNDIDACSKYVNLQRQGWYTQRNVPTLDQGPVGLCYSHAAVTLLDMWRDTHGLKITKNIALSNPQYAALLFKMEYEKGERSTLDAGGGANTLKAIKKYGMCRDDVIQLAMDEFSMNNKISTRDWYAVTQWFLEFYSLKIQREIDKAPDKAKKLKEIFSRYTDRDDVKIIYEHGDFNKIYEGLKPYLLKRDYKGYAKNVFRECFKKENIYLGTLHLPDVYSEPNPQKFIPTIISNLDRKNPVGISYAHQILKEGSGLFKKIKYFWYDSDHQGVLIGKRVRAEKCQFLLKNTWGNYCKYAWECQKSPNGGEVGAWIDADYLLPSLRTLYFFDMSK